MLKTIRKEVPDITYTKDNQKLEIYRELHQELFNPRQHDQLTTMLCGHTRYDLGDEEINSKNYSSWAEIEDELYENNDIIVCLSLYLLDHSGLSISTTPFRSRWDSGKVGFIYITKEKVKELGLEDKSHDELRKLAEESVKEYDKYIKGEVYRFVKYKDGEETHRCAGFLGSEIEENGLLEHSEIDDIEEWDKSTNY